MSQSEIHVIDNRTPESRDTIVGAAKWLDRIVDRYDQLPMSFTDSIPPESIKKLAAKLRELAD